MTSSPPIIPRVTRLKKAEEVLIGVQIPKHDKHDCGFGGRFIESVLRDAGYIISPNGTVDIEAMQLEIKSRNLRSTAPHTIGSMRFSDICSTPYEQSMVYAKCQRQLRVEWDSVTNIIVSVYLYDFTAPAIQELLKQSYETAREKILYQSLSESEAALRRVEIPLRVKVYRGTKFGYFESTQGDLNNYQFRMDCTSMTKLEALALTAKALNSLFEIE